MTPTTGAATAWEAPRELAYRGASGEFSLAIEDHDVELCRAPARTSAATSQRAPPRHRRDECPRSRESESFRRGVGADDAARELLRPAARPRHLSQRAKLDASAGGMKIEHALRELGDLGDAAGDGDARHGMGAQIFERAADEIAHVEQRRLGQIVERLDRRLGGAPVAPATWVSPVARATSMPLWIEAIHAAQE